MSCISPLCQLLQPPHRAWPHPGAALGTQLLFAFSCLVKIFFIACVSVHHFLGLFLLPFKFSSLLCVLLVPWAGLAVRQAREADANPVPVVRTKLSSLPLFLLMPSFISSSPFPCLSDSSVGGQQQLCSGVLCPRCQRSTKTDSDHDFNWFDFCQWL